MPTTARATYDRLGPARERLAQRDAELLALQIAIAGPEPGMIR
jgi:hypothetical protein